MVIAETKESPLAVIPSPARNLLCESENMSRYLTPFDMTGKVRYDREGSRLQEWHYWEKRISIKLIRYT